MENDFLKNAFNLWKSITQENEINQLQLKIEVYRKLFNLFQIGDYYSYVFNFASMECEYLSPGIEKVLGYSTNLKVSEFMGKVHPEDSIYYLNFESAAIDYLKRLPFEKLGKYKVQYDFRVRNAQGNYVRILHQAILIHFDEDKNFFRSLALHSDISHIKKTGIPCLSFIGLDDEPSYINLEVPGVFKTVSDSFSNRERVILKMIVAGKTSEEIANELFISLHTVNTHRKNILAKAQAKSPIDLIRQAIDNGWV
jgi:DNA-binding CsgD family transcriptional regulator